MRLPHHGALLGALLALLCACSSAVEVDAPDLSSEERAACDAFLAALPDALDGLAERDDLSPADAPARAWGDPAVVVTCGVDMPDDFDEFSSCEEVNGVGWYGEPDALTDQESDLELTTIGFTPNVRLEVPAERRPPVGPWVDVSNAVKQTLERTSRCA